MAFPVDRPGTYDPDKTWDEAGDAWVSTYVADVFNRVEYLVILGEQGDIYFTEVT